MTFEPLKLSWDPAEHEIEAELRVIYAQLSIQRQPLTFAVMLPTEDPDAVYLLLSTFAHAVASALAGLIDDHILRATLTIEELSIARTLSLSRPYDHTPRVSMVEVELLILIQKLVEIRKTTGEWTAPF